MAYDQSAHAQQDIQQQDSQPISTDQFASENPREIYARLRPDQRTAIGAEFHRLFLLSGDPEAQQYTYEINGTLTPEQVAAMHTYAQQRKPELFAQVMRHPVTVASLEAPGAAPTVEAAEVDVQGQTAGAGANDKPAERPNPNMLP